MSNELADVCAIIPYYNGAPYIERAVRSIENQTLPPRQVVIVDDGSKEPYTGPRVLDHGIECRTIRHRENRGIPAARNSGIRASDTTWVSFLDQDDEWVSDKLERQLRNLAMADRQEVVLFGRMTIANSGRSLPSQVLARWLMRNRSSFDIGLRLLSQGNFIPWGTVLARRTVFEYVGLLDESLVGGSDDYDFLIRAAFAGLLEWSADIEPVLIRHVHEANYSRADRFGHDNERILEKYDTHSDPRIQKAAKEGRASISFLLAREWHRNRKFDLARRLYRDAWLSGSGQTRLKSLGGELLTLFHIER